MKFSILICTIPRRQVFLSDMIQNITQQIGENTKDVEYIFDADENISVGEKRNRLLDKAKGDYIAFVDDDDTISTKYVDLVLEAIKKKPDVVGMVGAYYENGNFQAFFKHSIEYKSWNDNSEGKCKYTRPPNHLNPVKRDLALSIKFPSINIEEDRDYSMRLKDLLKTESMIPIPIYMYNYSTVKV